MEGRTQRRRRPLPKRRGVEGEGGRGDFEKPRREVYGCRRRPPPPPPKQVRVKSGVRPVELRPRRMKSRQETVVRSTTTGVGVSEREGKGKAIRTGMSPRFRRLKIFLRLDFTAVGGRRAPSSPHRLGRSFGPPLPRKLEGGRRAISGVDGWLGGCLAVAVGRGEGP